MRMLCNKKAIPILFILSLLLFPPVSFAEYVGSFSRIEGRVDLLRAGATAVVRARQGDGVSNGDIIRTKSDGRAEILFKDDTTVTVAPESRLKIDEYTFNPDNSRNKGILSLLRGKLRAAVSKVKAGLIPVSIGASTFNINTPTTVAGVRGTVLFVFYERGITGVVFKEGSGFVYNQNIPERIVNVSEGQATFILRDDAPPLPPRPATDAEMSQHIIDTTIKDTDTTPTDNGDTAAIQTETTHVDTADIMTALGETAGEDTSAPETISSGVDSSPPPPVLPITETDTETLKDTIPPLITITSSPQAITNSASGSFTITANEPVTFTYSMGSVVVTSTLTTSDTIDLAGLPEGGHTLNISATDEAGNISTTSYSWTTDYTPPASLALTGTPSSITNVNSATIGASATDANGVTYNYTLDGTTSTGTLTGLTEGTHTFVATATDGAGNISTTSYSWLTDYTAPASLALTGTPASITNINNATIGATATDASGVTYSYTLDGAASTGTLSGLTEGSHTFIATATDGAGNISTTSYSWLTDYTPPASLSLSGTPSSITNVNSATIGASATDANGVTYNYTLDGTTSTGTLTGLTEGTHTFVATATDGAGNISTTTYSWTTDYTAPLATLTPAASPEFGNYASINVGLSSNESSTFAYRLDGGSLTSTGATLALSGVPEGSHTVEVRATDAAGNPSTDTLTFDLTRYSLSGNFWGCIGNVTGTATGEVAGISGQNWGGWNIGMTGAGSLTPNPTWTLYGRGISLEILNPTNLGYWIEVAPGTSNFTNQTLSGTSTFRYLSFDRLGTGTGTLTGTYDGAGNYSLTDSGSGTYIETPLAFSGNIGFSSVRSELFYDGDGIVGTGHTDGGLLGGTVPSLSNPADVTYMGPYSATFAGPYMWTPIIYSGNAGTTFAPSYDNNKFWGYIGGVWRLGIVTTEGVIDGKIYSLYIDQNGDAGIIKGSLAGSYYPEITAYTASGAWLPPIGISTGLLQADLTDLTNSPNNTWNGINSSSGTVAGSYALTAWDADGRRDSITNQPWGIWQTKVIGNITNPIIPPFTTDQWNLTTESYGWHAFFDSIIGTQTDGTLWTINSGETIGTLSGTTYAYGADIIATPMTWISVGETIGTFDPVASTWQAVQTGAWLETNRYLAMTQTAGGQAALTALNIPFVEVGKASLTGTNSQWTVNMNNTTFFAYSNGAAPKIWATGDVSGNYYCSACDPTPTLTGSGLSANLNMQTWDTVGNKWIATVNGSGTLSGGSYSGPTTFNGAAAGTVNTSTSAFSGTGAGVAK